MILCAAFRDVSNNNSDNTESDCDYDYNDLTEIQIV